MRYNMSWQVIYLKKSIKKVIKLLELKKINNLTFKNISKLTGYHEKSLIKINKELKIYGKDEILQHGNKNKPSHNAITKDEQDYIMMLKNNSKQCKLLLFYKDYIDICNKDNLFKPRSYSAVCSVIRKNGSASSSTLVSKHIVIFKCVSFNLNNRVLKLYIAIDFKTSKILKIIFSRVSATKTYCDLLQFIIENYGLPSMLYTYGSLVLRAPVYGKTEFGRISAELGVEICYVCDISCEKTLKSVKSYLHHNLANEILNNKINTVEELNTFMNTYIDIINTTLPNTKNNLKIKYYPLYKNIALENIFGIKTKRKVLYNNIIQMGSNLYKILLPKNITLHKGTIVDTLKNFNDDTIKILLDDNIYITELIKKK